MRKLVRPPAFTCFALVAVYLFVAPLAKAQTTSFIEGQTPTPCKLLKSNDFIVPFYPYQGLPYPPCEGSPDVRTEDSTQGYGEDPTAYFFPAYPIIYRGGRITGVGYTTADRSAAIITAMSLRS
jgi:hypothetical protein